MEFLRNLWADTFTLSWLLVIALVFFGALWRLELPIAKRIHWLRRLVVRCKVVPDATEPRDGILAAISEVSWLHGPVRRFEQTWRNAYRSDRDAAVGEIHLADFISPDGTVKLNRILGAWR